MSTHAGATPEAAARLAELDRAGLLDVAPDPAFDRLARLARRAFDAAAGAITVVGSRGMRNLGRDGLAEPWASSREIAGEELLLTTVVEQGQAVAATDLGALPGMPSSFGMASGATAPVHGPSGVVLGAISVVTNEEREWTDRDLAVLADFAETVSSEIDLRMTAGSVARRERRAAAQQRALELITGDAPLEESLTAVAEAIEDAVGHELRCSVLLLDAEAGVVRDVAGPSLSPDAFRAAFDGDAGRAGVRPLRHLRRCRRRPS